MDRKPVDVMVVNFNTASLLQPMFDALRQADSEKLASYLVVDNASVDDSVERMAQVCPEALLLSNKKNVGFGRANNQLLAHLKGKYALLLNTDAFVAADSLAKTIEYMDNHPECGVLGVRLEGRDGDLQPSCRYFPTPLNVFVGRTGLGRFFPGLKMVDEMTWDHGSVRECDWLPGCFYLVRREVLDQVGLFDPRYFLYYEEVDHCKRVKEAGWKVVFYPHTTVVHIGGESSKSVSELEAASRQISSYQIESEMLYFRKHHGVAGLALHMLLVCVGDLVLALKALLKGARPRGDPGVLAALPDYLVAVVQDTVRKPTHTVGDVMFENIRADLRAHGGDWGAQGFWVLLVYRFGRWRYGVRPALLRKLFSILYKILFKFVQIITGVELPCEVVIGRNFVIDHFGGIVISGYARFGDDCRIRNGVVVGLKNVSEPIAPVFGNNVDIGTGAKVLGNIRIGNNVVIGANAVVLVDVPDNALAVGVPATIKLRNPTEAAQCTVE